MSCKNINYFLLEGQVYFSIFSIMRLLLATKNRHKVEELQYLLSGYDIQLLNLNDFPEITDIEETGSSFLENAIIKAKNLHSQFRIPVLADDSGLEVEYLNNRPGIYSKRYAGKKATDLDRIDKLLMELDNVPYNKRKARFVCAMVLIDKQNSFEVTGFCNGFISKRPAGKNGFGYDPVFFLPDLKKTMAQLSIKQKNMISHRANALKQIRKILTHFYRLKRS